MQLRRQLKQSVVPPLLPNPFRVRQYTVVSPLSPAQCAARLEDRALPWGASRGGGAGAWRWNAFFEADVDEGFIVVWKVERVRGTLTPVVEAEGYLVPEGNGTHLTLEVRRHLTADILVAIIGCVWVLGLIALSAFVNFGPGRPSESVPLVARLVPVAMLLAGSAAYAVVRALKRWAERELIRFVTDALDAHQVSTAGARN